MQKQISETKLCTLQSDIAALMLEDTCQQSKYAQNILQELIRRWDSERELLRSASGSYQNSLK